MTHCTKNGKPKILKACKFPLTGHQVVQKIITEKAVFVVKEQKLMLVEIASGSTLSDIRHSTEADFVVADWVKEMQ